MHLLTLLFGVTLVFMVGSSQVSGHVNSATCNSNEQMKCTMSCDCEAKYLTDCCVDPSFTGVINIKTREGKIFNAYCDQGWTYAFKRFDGSEDFYRTWVEYQHGFGKTDGEHFIGLDNLASFVKGRKCKVRIDLKAWPPVSPAKRFAEYSIFNVADENDKYRLTIGGYSGTAGDSMIIPHNDQPFSTHDQDNDKSDTFNCAAHYKGAWWYNACHHANLFGSYAQGPNCPRNAECVAWHDWPTLIGTPHNHMYSFKEASMKIHCC
ncbi:unnamed protein product [Owenia fusiformis]|uniref:Fibrinogen C-terminal domain-containing protein n=1 Tax=Owenia fusiformis TaxID=6347 RepID=A0A8S4PXZ1_OWEFU|nr:unnamed protein product [Owenia fusiformis]